MRLATNAHTVPFLNQILPRPSGLAKGNSADLEHED
jgi:hypothetical protein